VTSGMTEGTRSVARMAQVWQGVAQVWQGMADRAEYVGGDQF
jgi:hypothetical protein